MKLLTQSKNIFVEVIACPNPKILGTHSKCVLSYKKRNIHDECIQHRNDCQILQKGQIRYTVSVPIKTPGIREGHIMFKIGSMRKQVLIRIDVLREMKGRVDQQSEWLVVKPNCQEVICGYLNSVTGKYCFLRTGEIVHISIYEVDHQERSEQSEDCHSIRSPSLTKEDWKRITSKYKKEMSSPDSTYTETLSTPSIGSMESFKSVVCTRWAFQFDLKDLKESKPSSIQNVDEGLYYLASQIMMKESKRGYQEKKRRVDQQYTKQKTYADKFEYQPRDEILQVNRDHIHQRPKNYKDSPRKHKDSPHKESRKDSPHKDSRKDSPHKEQSSFVWIDDPSDLQESSNQNSHWNQKITPNNYQSLLRTYRSTNASPKPKKNPGLKKNPHVSPQGKIHRIQSPKFISSIHSEDT